VPEAFAGGDPLHDPAVDRIVFGDHDRRGVRPGLEQPALVPEERLQVLWLVRPDPAEDDELVARRHHAGRVELQEAQIPGDIEDPVGSRLAGRTGQTLTRDRQPSRRLGGDSAHRRSLVKELCDHTTDQGRRETCPTPTFEAHSRMPLPTSTHTPMKPAIPTAPQPPSWSPGLP